MEESVAYKDFKLRTQEIFSFAVLVTLSVPVLKQNIKLFDQGRLKRLPDPDYFRPSVDYEIRPETIEAISKNGIEQEKIAKLKELIGFPMNSTKFKKKVIDIIGNENYKKNRNDLKRQSKNYSENITNCTRNYQSKLATYLYFSTFSYFESFIMDISTEITRRLKRLEKEKYLSKFKREQEILSDMAKLDKEFDKRKLDRYKRFSKSLKAKGYIEPKEIIFSSLLDLYDNTIENLKANEIPTFLEKTFLFRMSEQEVEKFHTIRANRNSIGHGDDSFTPHLNDVIQANKYFKNLSRRIDTHITYYFFQLKNFVPE